MNKSEQQNENERRNDAKLVIIVEGCDNCGKTELIQKLAKEFDLPILYSGGYKPEQEMKDWLNRWIPRAPTYGFIFDRFHPISEAIYGPVLRGYSDLNVEDIKLYKDMVMTNLDPVVIFCRPSLNVVMESLYSRPQLAGVAERIIHLYELYEEAAEKFYDEYPKGTVLFYDWTLDPTGKYIMDYIKNQRRDY